MCVARAAYKKSGKLLLVLHLLINEFETCMKKTLDKKIIVRFCAGFAACLSFNSYAQSQPAENAYPKLSSIYFEAGHIKSTTNNTSASGYNVASTSNNNERAGVIVEFSPKWSGGLSIAGYQSNMGGQVSGNQSVSGSPSQTSALGFANYSFNPLLSAGGYVGYGQGPNTMLYGSTQYPGAMTNQLLGTYLSLTIPFSDHWSARVSPSYIYSYSSANRDSVTASGVQNPAVTSNTSINMANLSASASYLTAEQKWRFDAGVVIHQVLSQNISTTQTQLANFWNTPFLGANYTTDEKYNLYARASKELGDPRIGGQSVTVGISKNF